MLGALKYAREEVESAESRRDAKAKASLAARSAGQRRLVEDLSSARREAARDRAAAAVCKSAATNASHAALAARDRVRAADARLAGAELEQLDAALAKGRALAAV